MFDETQYHFSSQGVPQADILPALARLLYPLVWRRDFTQPGFALVSLGSGVDSLALRRLLLDLERALSGLYFQETRRHLAYHSVSRFDQQVTTKFHLDASPDEAVLVLGYEPTEVESVISLADFTRAALDWGMEPATLLAERNPMFPGHESRLEPYVTTLAGFDPGQAHVLLINNSRLPYRSDGSHALGVMHRAVIPAPRPDARRIVDSTLITTVDDPADEPAGRDVQEAFATTPHVAGEVKACG